MAKIVFAFLLYVSSNQVTAQVPYEVSIGAGIAVVVTNGANPPCQRSGNRRGCRARNLHSDGSGVGEATAINTGATSGLVTLNNTTNPAKIGDMVTRYLTGQGDSTSFRTRD